MSQLLHDADANADADVTNETTDNPFICTDIINDLFDSLVRFKTISLLDVKSLISLSSTNKLLMKEIDDNDHYWSSTFEELDPFYTIGGYNCPDNCCSYLKISRACRSYGLGWLAFAKMLSMPCNEWVNNVSRAMVSKGQKRSIIPRFMTLTVESDGENEEGEDENADDEKVLKWFPSDSGGNKQFCCFPCMFQNEGNASENAGTNANNADTNFDNKDNEDNDENYDDDDDDDDEDNDDDDGDGSVDVDELGFNRFSFPSNPTQIVHLYGDDDGPAKLQQICSDGSYHGKTIALHGKFKFEKETFLVIRVTLKLIGINSISGSRAKIVIRGRKNEIRHNGTITIFNDVLLENLEIKSMRTNYESENINFQSAINVVGENNQSRRRGRLYMVSCIVNAYAGSAIVLTCNSSAFIEKCTLATKNMSLGIIAKNNTIVTVKNCDLMSNQNGLSVGSKEDLVRAKENELRSSNKLKKGAAGICKNYNFNGLEVNPWYDIMQMDYDISKESDDEKLEEDDEKLEEDDEKKEEDDEKKEEDEEKKAEE